MISEFRNNRTIAFGPYDHALMRKPILDKTAISPYDHYCDGYGMPGAYGNGYINILKVSCGVVDKTEDELIDDIVSYDKAECADAYTGQINMLTASSFCGIMGQVWGYDLAVHPDILENKKKPIFVEAQFSGLPLYVYDAKPLIDAGIELFGTDNNRRYHLAPGAHTICANKGVSAYRPHKDKDLAPGEAYGVWCFIALSLSTDRDYCADLFIEDAGLWTQNDNELDLIKFLEGRKKEIIWSVIECGADSGVLFDRTYIAYNYVMMEPNQVGNAITVGPYFSLARNAVPAAGFDALRNMSLNEWLQNQDFKSLSGL